MAIQKSMSFTQKQSLMWVKTLNGTLQRKHMIPISPASLSHNLSLLLSLILIHIGTIDRYSVGSELQAFGFYVVSDKKVWASYAGLW